MTRKQQRLYAIVLVLTGVIIATALTLTALRNTVSFFYTPSDIVGEKAKIIAPDRDFRLGGMVVFGSIEHTGTTIHFTVTDYAHDLPVSYNGIAPALFAEGKGVVATGRMDGHGIFMASELLAKHDENYVPPDMAKTLKRMQAAQQPKAP